MLSCYENLTFDLWSKGLLRDLRVQPGSEFLPRSVYRFCSPQRNLLPGSTLFSQYTGGRTEVKKVIQVKQRARALRVW